MKLITEASVEQPQALEKEADEEIAKFDEWFITKLGNAPLVKSERYIIKTFLYYMVHKDKS